MSKNLKWSKIGTNPPSQVISRSVSGTASDGYGITGTGNGRTEKEAIANANKDLQTRLAQYEARTRINISQ